MALSFAPLRRPIRILSVDDHALFSAGLRLLLEGYGFAVVGSTRNLADAVAMASREQPDVILLDLLMGSESGLDYIQDLARVARTARILILTSVRDSKTHQRAVQLGAMGLLLKDTTPDILVKAIKKVHEGEAWVDRSTMGAVLAEMSKSSKSPNNGVQPGGNHNVTKRERSIITLVARGYKNKQIAETLGISNVTVRHHLTSVFGKLSVADRFELMIYAFEHGLADVPRAEKSLAS